MRICNSDNRCKGVLRLYHSACVRCDKCSAKYYRSKTNNVVLEWYINMRQLVVSYYYPEVYCKDCREYMYVVDSHVNQKDIVCMDCVRYRGRVI